MTWAILFGVIIHFKHFARVWVKRDFCKKEAICIEYFSTNVYGFVYKLKREKLRDFFAASMYVWCSCDYNKQQACAYKKFYIRALTFN